jgi:succinate dehydrogenase flavoprotein subunit
MTLESKMPSGPLADKWDRHKFEIKLVNPANKRKFNIIVVGTGLAGASAAASLGELGYNVHSFCIHDSPRRAHSIAAQGGINAAKNYKNDGDSVQRLFYDTIKGGDYRAREANVYRLAQLSVNIIDQCVAQGVPFAREYGGLLDNRSFGGAQVLRARADGPAAPAGRLPGADAAGGRRQREAVPAPRDARPGDRQRQGAGHHLPQSHDW